MPAVPRAIQIIIFFSIDISYSLKICQENRALAASLLPVWCILVVHEIIVHTGQAEGFFPSSPEHLCGSLVSSETDSSGPCVELMLTNGFG